MNKIKSITLALLTLLAMNNVTQAQQRAEEFVQPYALGSQSNSNNFTGDVWVAKITAQDELTLPTYNVTFAPGCINSWHYHTEGQVLVAGAGVGYYQEEGKPARLLHAGDIVEIAPHVKHWHGAAPHSWFSHLALMPKATTNQTVWLEPVGEEAYKSAVAESLKPSSFVSEELTSRDRAIIALGANTGAGNLEALKTAAVQALEAGMTQNEIKEILVQAYAYSGFPRSLRALQTFMQVIEDRKSKGIQDPEGKEASPITAKESKYQRGAEILATLTGVAPSATKTGYAAFAPVIDTFLKEHLFCDIFERDVLSFKDRELATVSIITGVGGVEPMAKAHIGISKHIGWTANQIKATLDVLSSILGENSVRNLRD